MDDLTVVQREVQQYVALKTEIDSLTDRRDVIKKRLLAWAESDGEPNDKGSLVLDVNDSTTGTRAVVKQRRVSKVFNEDAATEILTARGLYESCTKTVVTLDEDAVMGAYYKGELSDDDIDTMFPEKIIWALILEKE